MASLAETFWAEVLARLEAAPALDVKVIKRAHRTPVTRSNSPAIHVVEGDAVPTENKACVWHWRMEGSVVVYGRGDSGATLTDPLVVAVLDRINPEALTATPYSNNVRVDLAGVKLQTEVADGDATAVDVDLRVSFLTRRWTLDQPAT